MVRGLEGFKSEKWAGYRELRLKKLTGLKYLGGFCMLIKVTLFYMRVFFKLQCIQESPEISV